METELVCNYRKCRRKLTAVAWVTSCSHIFCNEDGTREFEKALKCPACDTILPEKFDIVRTDLNPSEPYKSMVLAGQNPEIIMGICSRAIAFWTYQVHQETAYQEYVGKKYKSRCAQLENLQQHANSKQKVETDALKQQVETMKKELEIQKQKNNEISEKFLEKSRNLHKLQGMYDNLRRKAISTTIFDKPQKPPQKIGDTLNKPGCDEFRLTTITDIISISPAPGIICVNSEQPEQIELRSDRPFVLNPVREQEIPGPSNRSPRPRIQSQYK